MIIFILNVECHATIFILNVECHAIIFILNVECHANFINISITVKPALKGHLWDKSKVIS